MTLQLVSITETFAVAPQLAAYDMQEVADAGFKSVIINRPDFESGPDQPTSQDVIVAARQAGLVIEYQPVVSGRMTPIDVQRFAELLKEMPEPILAYCRSGARCTHLYYAATES